MKDGPMIMNVDFADDEIGQRQRRLWTAIHAELGNSGDPEQVGAVLSDLGCMAAMVWITTAFEGRAMIPFLKGFVDQAVLGHQSMVAFQMRAGEAQLAGTKPAGSA